MCYNCFETIYCKEFPYHIVILWCNLPNNGLKTIKSTNENEREKFNKMKREKNKKIIKID